MDTIENMLAGAIGSPRCRFDRCCPRALFLPCIRTSKARNPYTSSVAYAGSWQGGVDSPQDSRLQRFGISRRIQLINTIVRSAPIRRIAVVCALFFVVLRQHRRKTCLFRFFRDDGFLGFQDLLDFDIVVRFFPL